MWAIYQTEHNKYNKKIYFNFDKNKFEHRTQADAKMEADQQPRNSIQQQHRNYEKAEAAALTMAHEEERERKHRRKMTKQTHRQK